jgi:hypothetical protein
VTARLDTDPGPLRAYELVMRFASRRGEAAIRLAMHAAVPLVLRAELLHLIRLNFVPEAAQDLAIEADVLFAAFCEDIGNGYYCFGSNARLQLLQGLDPAYPDEPIPRSAQVAGFMLDYLDHEDRDVRTSTDRLRLQWIEVERWSALAFAKPELAARQLAAVLARVTANDKVAARLRLGGLSSALATPLARFGELLAYAQGVDALEKGRSDVASRLFGSMPDRDIEIAGVTLKSPRRVITETAGREAPAVEVAESAEQAEARLEREPSSYVGGLFEHDVYVTCPHGQDLSVAYRDPARDPLYEWSCKFVDHLRSQLELVLSDGDRRPDVRMDPSLNSTGPLEGSLVKEVQSSALLLVLMSHYYLRSAWCADESRLFSESAQTFSPISRRDRTFVVSVGPTDRDRWPLALKDDQQRAFLGMAFYRDVGPEDWTPFGFPAADEEYWTGIKRLASEIASQLRRMKHSQANKTPDTAGAAVPMSVGRKLLLGYCSDSLVGQRGAVRKALSALELQILPEERDDITDPQSLSMSYERYLT